MKDPDDGDVEGGDDEPLPTLTPEIVEDEQALADAVDLFIAADPEARARLSEIALLQDVVRKLVDADLWQLLVRLDEMITERWADALVAGVGWSFDAGRRFPDSEVSS